MSIAYAKIWTACYVDEWFLSLNCLERGVWLQLIITAKMQADTGQICYKNVASLSAHLAIDCRTLTKMLQKCLECAKIEPLSENKFANFEICNYEYWQGLKNFKDWKNNTNMSAQMRPKQHKSRAEQSNIRASEEKPINRFEKWLSKNQETYRKIVKKLCGLKDADEVPPKIQTLVISEFRKMKAWVVANPQKGNKKQWSRFVNTWLAGAIDKYYMLQNPLTSEEEKKHYEQKRRQQNTN